MKEIIITAKSEAGVGALKTHFEESIKLSKVHKVQFRLMGFRQEVVSEDPFTLKISITNSYYRQVLRPESFLVQIHEALASNGANSKDYDVEVILDE